MSRRMPTIAEPGWGWKKPHRVYGIRHRVVAALTKDPALLHLHRVLLVADIRKTFGVSDATARRALACARQIAKNLWIPVEHA